MLLGGKNTGKTSETHPQVRSKAIFINFSSPHEGLGPPVLERNLLTSELNDQAHFH